MDAVKLLGSLLNNNSMGSNVLGSLLGGGGGSDSKSAGGGGGLGSLGALAGMLGGSGGGSQGGGGGGLGALVGMLGGGSGGSQGSGGGLGALVGMLGGGSGGSQGGGGGGLGALAGMLGGGGGQGGGGAAGGLLGALVGMASGGGGGGDQQQGLASAAVPKEVEDEATLLIRAMCQAAKADGRLDDDEKKKILGRLGDVTQAEVDFVQGELSSPLDAAGFAADVPKDSALKVYAFSLVAIKLDEQSEAQYLADLAKGLGLDAAACNAIHDRLEAPRIFS